MTLLEAITVDDQVLLSPAGSDSGQPIDGEVNPAWFAKAFPELAQATAPLSDEQYSKLKAIDTFWAANADRWRAEGRI